MSLVGASLASAEPALRGRYIRVEPRVDVDIDDHERGVGATLYLNRCDAGCAITPGGDSSLADTSSIVSGGVALSPWARGDSEWTALVSCVRGIFEPYNIDVTDVSPGVAPHHEVMVAGTFAEFGLAQPALGVAPLSCSAEPNSLTFVFANEPASLAAVCQAAAQEPGHAWGLDHELLCEDPMTYLGGCGPKVAFQDAVADCGEDVARPCECGGLTQNSHQRIAALFGTRASDGPAVAIIEPADGATVSAGFAITVEATDDAEIASVEVLANGQSIQTTTLASFTFAAPSDLDGGLVEIEVQATNVHGAVGAAIATVNLRGEGGSGQPDSTGGGVSPPRGGCGCQTGGQGSGLALVLVGLALAISRRERAGRRAARSRAPRR